MQIQILTLVANMVLKGTPHYYAQDSKSPGKLTCAVISGNTRRTRMWDRKGPRQMLD